VGRGRNKNDHNPPVEVTVRKKQGRRWEKGGEEQKKRKKKGGK